MSEHHQAPLFILLHVESVLCIIPSNSCFTGRTVVLSKTMRVVDEETRNQVGAILVVLISILLINVIVRR